MRVVGSLKKTLWNLYLPRATVCFKRVGLFLDNEFPLTIIEETKIVLS